MTLHILSDTEENLKPIAEDLLRKRLLTHITIEGPKKKYGISNTGGLTHTELFRLKGLSKSLLFKKINDRVRQKFNGTFTLLYSEPIIMIDSEHTEMMIDALLKT